MRRNYFRRQAGKGLHPLGYPENLPVKIGKGGEKGNTIKLRKGDEQNVNFTEKHLTKLRKSEVSLPAAMKPIEIGV